MRVEWKPRTIPLAAAGAIGMGAVAPRLAARALSRTDVELGRLTGVAGDALVVLFGATEDLPWVDGVVYVGRDPCAPSLFVPTNLEANVALELLERAVLARGVRAPAVVWPGSAISASGARVVARARLERVVARGARSAESDRSGST